MKIAILSCNTGGGHNAAAAALAEELSARGHESRTYNTLDFLPKGAADLISRGHDFAYRYAPKLYGAGYRMEEKRPSPLLYENSIRGIGPLYEALVDLGADAAICVHVFPAMMMTELRCGYGLRMPTWFVATDFTCSPGVGELQLDGICIPHPALTPEFQAAGLPAQRIFPTGIPIRRQFCQTPDRDAARRQLELEGCRHVFTLACGSMGAGPLRSTAACIAGLLGPEDRLVAVCGSNQRMHRQMIDDFVDNPRVRVLGFTDRMCAYMQASDLLISKAGGLTIIKKDEETGKRIKGVQFEVRKLNGEIIGTYTTDTNGVISLPQAEKGWYQVVELKAAEGYKLDDTPHQIEVKDGGTAILEITNRQTGSALIHKIDSVTGKGIFGVKFLLSDAKGNPIGTYESDNEGYVYIDHELADGRYTIREIECADGYILDTQPKTIYVEYGGCTTITWPNAALRGQIQIIKKSAEYNSVNGLPAGTLLEGATFEIYNERNGALVDTIVSDNRGLAVSKPLPLGRYTIRETKAPANYSANGADITAVLEYSGQIVKFEVTNKSANTGISISKTGPKEAVGGQPVRYVFSKIGNTGNVTLQSFYWRDTLPAAVTLDKVVTGTYNRPGNYKIVYKVNNTGDYRTLADNLSTSQNYTLAASPVALGLAANERVTEIMFIFGQAPGGFGQVEAPMLYCTAVKGLTAGSSFVNVADVGGVYNGAWVQAVTRWVTTVYGKPTPLPRTGY